MTNSSASSANVDILVHSLVDDNVSDNSQEIHTMAGHVYDDEVLAKQDELLAQAVRQHSKRSSIGRKMKRGFQKVFINPHHLITGGSSSRSEQKQQEISAALTGGHKSATELSTLAEEEEPQLQQRSSAPNLWQQAKQAASSNHKNYQWNVSPMPETSEKSQERGSESTGEDYGDQWEVGSSDLEDQPSEEEEELSEEFDLGSLSPSESDPDYEDDNYDELPPKEFEQSQEIAWEPSLEESQEFTSLYLEEEALGYYYDEGLSVILESSQEINFNAEEEEEDESSESEQKMMPTIMEQSQEISWRPTLEESQDLSTFRYEEDSSSEESDEMLPAIMEQSQEIAWEPRLEESQSKIAFRNFLLEEEVSSSSYEDSSAEEDDEDADDDKSISLAEAFQQQVCLPKSQEIKWEPIVEPSKKEITSQSTTLRDLIMSHKPIIPSFGSKKKKESKDPSTSSEDSDDSSDEEAQPREKQSQDREANTPSFQPIIPSFGSKKKKESRDTTTSTGKLEALAEELRPQLEQSQEIKCDAQSAGDQTPPRDNLSRKKNKKKQKKGFDDSNKGFESSSGDLLESSGDLTFTDDDDSVDKKKKKKEKKKKKSTKAVPEDDENDKKSKRRKCRSSLTDSEVSESEDDNPKEKKSKRKSKKSNLGEAQTDEEERLPPKQAIKEGKTTRSKNRKSLVDLAMEEAEEAPLPEGWNIVIDPNSGAEYYWNMLDGTTSWERPVLQESVPTSEQPIFQKPVPTRVSLIPPLESDPVDLSCAESKEKSSRKKSKKHAAVVSDDELASSEEEREQPQKSKKKSKKSKVILTDDDEPTKKSKRKSKKSMYLSSDDELVSSGDDKEQTKKSKRKSKKSLYLASDDELASSGDEKEQTKKSKRKSKKSMCMSSDEELISSGDEKEQTKKSKKKSKKSMYISSDDELASSSNEKKETNKSKRKSKKSMYLSSDDELASSGDEKKHTKKSKKRSKKSILMSSDDELISSGDEKNETRKSKRKSKKSVYMSSDDDLVSSGDEKERTKKSKRKSKKSMYMSSDDELMSSDDDKAQAKKSKRKSKKSMYMSSDDELLSSGDDKEQAKKTKSKSKKSAILSSDGEISSLEDPDIGATKKEKRKGKKLASFSSDGEISSLEEPDAGATKKEKKKKKKSAVASNGFEIESPDHDKEQTKKSEVKNRKSKSLDVDKEDEGPLPKNKEILLEDAAVKAETKKNDKKSNEEKARDRVNMLINGPTDIEVEMLDDISVLTIPKSIWTSEDTGKRKKKNKKSLACIEEAETKRVPRGLEASIEEAKTKSKRETRSSLVSGTSKETEAATAADSLDTDETAANVDDKTSAKSKRKSPIGVEDLESSKDARDPEELEVALDVEGQAKKPKSEGRGPAVLVEEAASLADAFIPHDKKSICKSKTKGRTSVEEGSQQTSTSHTTGSEDKAITLSTLRDDVAITRSKLVNLGKPTKKPTMSQNLLKFMEKMLDSFAEVSDALELIVSFSSGEDAPAKAKDAQKALSCITENYVTLLDFLWRAHLLSAVERYWWKEAPNEKHKDFLYRAALMLTALTAQFRDQFIERGEFVGSIERNPESKRLFVTLFELLRHEAFAVGSCQRDAGAVDLKTPSFQPSAMLQEAWGVTSDSQIWHEVYAKASNDPRNFRRACIRFVVNASKNLTICKKAMAILLDYTELELPDLLDESSQVNITNSQSANPKGVARPAAIPKAAKLALKNIRCAPLAREQIVDQVLHRILRQEVPDASSAPISVLQGRPCVGKTTIAALVAQHRSVREHFRDAIIWIRLGSAKDLCYVRYMHHLKSITKVFRESIELEEDCQLHVPGEAEANRSQRERRAMSQLKDAMTTYLKNKRVLLILDDLCNQSDLEWYDFSSDQQEGKVQVLVTTRTQDLVADDNTISVTKLAEEKDAAWLFHKECNSTTRVLSGRSLDMSVRAFFESDVVRSMVQLCSLHPMTVATLGRFVALHSQQSSMNGHESLVAIGELFTKLQSSGGIAAFLEVLNMSLSPTAKGAPSRAIQLCVVAYVTVFCSERQLLDPVEETPFPRVPVDIAGLLFESVLAMDDEILKEEAVFYEHKDSAADLIQQVLSVLGVLSDHTSSSTRTTYLTHQVYVEYVQDQIQNNEQISQFARKGGKAWHRALVSNLQDTSEDWQGSDWRQHYIISLMPFHMVSAEMFVEAGEMLSSKKFVKRRISWLGLTGAVKRHIKDMECLLEGLVPGSSDAKIDSRPYYILVIRQAYQTMVDTIAKLDNANGNGVGEGEVTRALLSIGSSFSKWHCNEDAIPCWMAGLLASSSMSVVERSEVLFCVGAAYEQLHEDQEAINFLKQCLQLRRIAHGDKHLSCAMALQKIADLLFLTATDTSEALAPYIEALGIFASHDDDAEDVERSTGHVHEMLGRIYYKRGEQVTALDHFMSALTSKRASHGKKSPLLVPLYNQVGMAVLELKKKKDAREAFERALKLVETGDEDIDLYNPDFLIPKGMVLGMDGKKKASRRCFKRALEVLGSDKSIENEWKLSFVKYTLTMFDD